LEKKTASKFNSLAVLRVLPFYSTSVIR
jgi:hypothetical protein